MSEANKWLFVDQDLPNVGENVLVKFCVVDRITGDTTMVDAEGQFTGFWKGSANFEVTMETNPLSLNSRTKIIAWKRSDSIEEKPDEETDDKETADEETESFWEEYYDHGIFKFRCHFCRTDAKRGSIGFYLPRRCPNCDSVMILLNTTDGQFQMAEDEKEEKDTVEDNVTEEIKKDKIATVTRSIVVDKGIWYSDTAHELKRWLDTIQFDWGAEVISVTETKVFPNDAQAFIILYKIDVDEKGNEIKKPLR